MQSILAEIDLNKKIKQ